MSRDHAALQLEKWNEENKDYIPDTTDSAGVPVVEQDVSLTIGKYGLIPLIDFNLTQQLGHFVRERVPERVVHAKGAGAYGYFKVTNDITRYTISKLFEMDKKTTIAVRFSTVAGNLGSADTVRDPRGFAVKFYSEEGNWDLVGNNTPIFFMRDPILFPMFIHSQKRNPATNMRDWDMFWDFLSLRPESVHQVMFLFSDRGIPDGYRHQHGYGSHTFSLIGENRKLTWCKFHYKTDQGIKNLDPKEAMRIAGEDPDYAVRDLYNAIAEGAETRKYPSWTLYIQVMTPEEAKTVQFNPFDITKVWPHEQFPLIQVGKIVLDHNPNNFFAEVEQLSFNPNNMIPGIGPSPDRLLQGRLFSYQDAHYYRIGPNFEQLLINDSVNTVSNFQRDGFATLSSQGGAPNWHPNSFGGPNVDPNARNGTMPPQHFEGDLDYYDLRDDDNFSQPRIFWNKVLDSGAKERLCKNLADTIILANKTIQNRTLEMFNNVDPEMGKMIRNNMHRVITVEL